MVGVGGEEAPRDMVGSSYLFVSASIPVLTFVVPL